MTGIDSFASIIGQTQAKAILRIALETQNKTGGAFPSVLITGPAGCGKTSIATAIAASVGKRIYTDLGHNLSNPKAINKALLRLKSEECWFIDEVHSIGAIETLYKAMEGNQVFLGTGLAFDLNPFTLIGATTDPQRLSPSFIDRFQIQIAVTHYSLDELTELIEKRAAKEGIRIDSKAANGIANLSKGVPRIAVRLLHSCQRFCKAKDQSKITSSVVKNVMKLECLDNIGLNKPENEYLKTLSESESPIRKNILANSLGISVGALGQIECDLVRLKLISKETNGRFLTEKGKKHIRGGK